jgi:hypothetical protein
MEGGVSFSEPFKALSSCVRWLDVLQPANAPRDAINAVSDKNDFIISPED